MRRILLLLLPLAACDGAIFGELPTDPGSVQAPGGPLPTLQTPEEELPPFAPAPFRARLLTAVQYRRTVASLLGPEAAAAVTPPRDVPVNGLSSIGAASLAISGAAVDAYEASAYRAAQAALTARRAWLVPCAPATVADATCMRQVVVLLLPKAFRRPATDAEIVRWTDVGLAAARAFDVFDRGVEFVVAGVLQSPAFLYLEESGEPVSAGAPARRLGGYQLASRVAYFLTNAPPDEELLAAAASGLLDTDAGLRAQARRLLGLPTAREAMQDLFDELLELEKLEHLAKDAQRFPGFQAALGHSMREETRRTVADVAFDRPADFREVLTRPTTFVDGPLAQHYGLPPVSGWTQVQTRTGRAGLLTQASFLSLMSHPSQNSPTYRGRFIREKLLCQTIPAPPPNVSTTLPETPPGTQRTLRQKVELHMQSASCRGCHQLMDPPGFAFEGFDAVGREQVLDDGLPIDTSGSLDDVGSFTDAEGLMGLLAKDPRVTACLARQVYRQGVGHVDTAGEQRPLRDAERAFAAGGYRYQDLLVELVATEAFRTGTLELP